MEFEKIEYLSLESAAEKENILSCFFRRSLDIVISALILLVTAPIMLLFVYLIKRDSPGPALFAQTRIGKDGKPFTFYKFRTMFVDAKQRFPELYAYKYNREEIKNLKFKIKDDPRVTSFGKIIRQTSFDELPNFINVLLGDMALVGPRPDIPEMIQYYTPEQRLKLTRKPGITGYAQISGRGNLLFQDTLLEDVRYIREQSLLIDLKVIWLTILAVVTGKGAY